VYLLSGGDHDCARYDILGVKPWLSIRTWGRRVRIEAGNRAIDAEADPFETLRSLLRHFKTVTRLSEGQPMSAGLMGYLSYDLKDMIETLPRTSVDRWGLPHLCLFAPSIILVNDHDTGCTWLALPEADRLPEADLRRQWLFDRLRKSPIPSEAFSCRGEGIQSNFTRSDYLETVDRIREYIADGHVYQVNVSQRFETGFSGDPFALFKALYGRNPAPFFAFVNAGCHQIVSTSPERFLCRRGQRIETRPIKGTRPRGETEKADLALRESLVESAKDDAELSMIVDLLRNDIGKVCEAGSVTVTRHKKVEAYDNVYHLVSIVEGRLDPCADSVDLLKATFPGGSITGCPKIRSMEIIDELEPDRRHIYTGSIGYFSFHDTLDLSIAIRTATIHKDRLCFSVGGGIVFDSCPAEEYDETLHKGRTLMGIFNGKDAPNRPASPVVWINGRLISAEKAVISIADQGVLYGNGFFETLRVDRGHPLHIDAHLKRFRLTWEALFAPERFPDITWPTVIEQVIDHNQLGNGLAAVRITATRGNPDECLPAPGLFVTAKPYQRRLEKLKRPGLSLATYPEPRQSPLASWKTLNYLYYLRAGRWASDEGADEALILNPDGTVSETNTANLLLLCGDDLVVPLSPHVLPGVMESEVLKRLAKEGFGVRRGRIMPEDLMAGDQVILTNSLMGAVPVLEIDGRLLNASTDLATRINTMVGY
ncbi:MAG: aminodeoxychorismate synthase component I, partial [Desulfobacterales bacterium]